MKNRSRIWIVALLACCFATSPAIANPPQPSGGAKALDIALVRPLGIPVATVSTVLFIATMGLTVLSGVGKEAASWMVAAPWRFTAARPLGDFDRYLDGRDAVGRATEAPGVVRARRRALW